MELGLHLNVGMRLEQKLTPQMIQSLKILQVTSLELEQMIKEELETNPVLEIEEFDERSESEDYGDERDQDTESPLNELSTADEAATPDWDEYYDEGFDLGFRLTDAEEQPEEKLRRESTYERGMRDNLLDQVADKGLSPEVRELVEYLVDSLDDDGLLRSATEIPPAVSEDHFVEIERVIARDADIWDVSVAVREAFHALWSLEPAGIGGRDLQECLLLQWRRMGGGSELAKSILEDAFPMLMKLQVSALARHFEVSSEDIQGALKEISRLDPKPGKGLGSSAAPAAIPDLIVEEDDDGELQIYLNDRQLPLLRVSENYRLLSESNRVNKDEKTFLKKKIDGASWLIRSIEQRKTTMLKVMHAIVALQPGFFREGLGGLKPMILQDVADRIEMHISTVNRVTNGKFVQTPFGVFELKQFFTSKVEQDDGSEASAAGIRQAIRELIEAEDPKSPLSDQAIADALDKQGLNVARRTVAKYREQMEFLPARMRKKF